MRYITIVGLLVVAFLFLAVPVPLSAEVGIAITFGPPALPIYEQPPCPEEGYIWTPGYWAWDYDYDDYYWVPGTWVLAPEVGFFWTPGYWAWVGDRFTFYDGYWGPEVGFYGGINYGFGYFGEGFVGGRWDNGRFFYNRAVTNVNVTNIRNVYNNTTVINNTTVTRVSYNGGNGGITARPTPQQEAIARGRHIAPVAAQTQHVREARSNPQLRASANQGRPPVAATVRPGSFGGPGVVPAREAGAPYHPAPNRGGGRAGARNEGAPNEGRNAGRNVVHPNDMPRRELPPPANTGNSRADQKYQQQQQKLQAQQDRDRQKLQQRQDREHQRVQPQAPDNPRMQQLEQRHQQQTQRLQERQSQQWEKMQQRQPQQRQPEERRSRPPG